MKTCIINGQLVHEYIPYDYFNTFIVAAVGFSLHAEKGVNLESPNLKDEDLLNTLKGWRNSGCRFETLSEMYTDPVAGKPKKNREADPNVRDLLVWMAENPLFVTHLDNLIQIINTTENMPLFKKTFDEAVVLVTGRKNWIFKVKEDELCSRPAPKNKSSSSDERNKAVCSILTSRNKLQQ